MKVPALAGTGAWGPWSPETQKQCLTVANWLTKFVREVDTSQPDSAIAMWADQQGVYAFQQLPPWFEMPCLLYTSPSPRDGLLSRMPSSA